MKKETNNGQCKENLIRSEAFQQIIDAIGFENARKLSRIFGGCYIYILTPIGLERPYRNQLIRSEFNGYNYMELAVKYKLSEQWIREIVKSKTI